MILLLKRKPAVLPAGFLVGRDARYLLCIAVCLHVQERLRPYEQSLGEGVLVLVERSGGLVVGDVAYSQVLEQGVECFSDVAECDCAVMRVLLADQHVAVEAAHLRNGEDSDASE